MKKSRSREPRFFLWQQVGLRSGIYLTKTQNKQLATIQKKRIFAHRILERPKNKQFAKSFKNCILYNVQAQKETVGKRQKRE